MAISGLLEFAVKLEKYHVLDTSVQTHDAAGRLLDVELVCVEVRFGNGREWLFQFAGLVSEVGGETVDLVEVVKQAIEMHLDRCRDNPVGERLQDFRSGRRVSFDNRKGGKQKELVVIASLKGTDQVKRSEKDRPAVVISKKRGMK